MSHCLEEKLLLKIKFICLTWPTQRYPSNSQIPCEKRILKQNKIYHFFKRFWKWHIALVQSSVLLNVTGLLCYFLEHLFKEKAFLTNNIWQQQQKNSLWEPHYFEHRLVGNKLQNKFSHSSCLDFYSQEWCLFFGLCHITSLNISVPLPIKEKKTKCCPNSV